MISAFDLFNKLAGRPAIKILYGSVHGNAQSIAELIQQDGIAKGFDAMVQSLNDFKKVLEVDTGQEEINLIIVCSTTGDGEPPANAVEFFKYIKHRKPDPANFFHINYVVFGVGDSNYRSFCTAGKYVDNMLQKIGCARKTAMICADAANNFDEVVEGFRKNVWGLFKTEDNNLSFKQKMTAYFKSERRTPSNTLE
jgi:sulfite reductase alpha subunit-like flavoprotein